MCWIERNANICIFQVPNSFSSSAIIISYEFIFLDMLDPIVLKQST